jgi:hypothetical protein
MKAMLWKELRENLKWAILAMIGLTFAEIYGLYYHDPNNYQDQGITSLCKATFLMATTFGCALTGLVLGFLQILPEQSRDRWAALLHRPVTRGVIYRGKAVAGILLYLIATISPFLVSVWLVATPGHFVSPFVPGTMLPGVVDMCAGLVYYFSALVLALQRGSWFGARMLAPFAAVHLSLYLPTYEDSVTHIIEAAVLLGLALFTAAWGAMLSNGSFRDRPWLGKAALIIVVFYGLCGVGDLAKILSTMGVEENSNSGPQYKITTDGVPLIVTRNADLSETVTDLEGHVINDDRYKGQQANENFFFPDQVSYLIGDTHGLDFSKRWPNYRSVWTYINSVEINDGMPHLVQWFYLPKKKYFVGISNLNKLPVKIADRKGIEPLGTVPEPFQFEANWPDVYSTGAPSLVNEGRTVYLYDFVHETFSQLPNPDQARVFFATKVSIRTAKPGVEETVIALATANELRVYDLKGNQFATLPYHQDVDRLGMINLNINATHDRFYVQYSASNWIDWSERHLMTSYLEEVDATGNVIHSYVLPALPNVPPVQTWASYIADRAQTPFFWYGTVGYQKICAALGIPHYDDRGYNPFYPYRSHPHKLGIQLLLVSLLLAPIAFAWARLRHFSWPRAAAWAVFVFAFNIAGLITFRLVADWPVQVRCPQCSRKRPVEESECPHCHTPWPSPPRSGIEIFDEDFSGTADASHQTSSLVK